MYCGYLKLFRNVWVCVCVCGFVMCGCVCISGFLMCGCVWVCNVCVCVWGWFEMCGCLVSVMCGFVYLCVL